MFATRIFRRPYFIFNIFQLERPFDLLQSIQLMIFEFCFALRHNAGDDVGSRNNKQ